MWNLKYGTKESIYRTETDSQTQRTWLGLGRGTWLREACPKMGSLGQPDLIKQLIKGDFFPLIVIRWYAELTLHFSFFLAPLAARRRPRPGIEPESSRSLAGFVPAEPQPELPESPVFVAPHGSAQESRQQGFVLTLGRIFFFFFFFFFFLF